MPLKQTLYLFSFHRYNEFNSGAVTSLSTPFRVNRTKPVSFVCARFVPICAVKINIVSISPPLEITNIIRGSDVHPTSSKSHRTGVVRLCSICAGLCRYDERVISKEGKNIKYWIRDSDVTLHPMPSKSPQTGAFCLCSICVLFCTVEKNIINYSIFYT